MLRRLLAAAPLALFAACIIPPGDREQIDNLIDDRAAALARDDASALYRMHDLDFRMLCPLDRFARLPRNAAPVGDVRSIEIRGSRATATIAAANGREERLDFVKDAGRWYLYADVEPCLRRAAVKDG